MPKKLSDTTSPNIQPLSAKADEEFISTGYEDLDRILGGGVYRGRITQFWGKEGVGKTHVASTLMANLSDTQKVLYVDAEFSLNKDRIVALGGKPENIDYVADSHLERVTELINASVGKYDVIILDSLAAIVPLTIDSAEVGDTSNIGLFARLVKHWVIKLKPRLAASKTAMIVINQFRAGIGLYSSPEPPGGMAFKHALDCNVLMSVVSKDKFPTHHFVICKTTKNKMSQPYQEARVKVVY